MGGGTHRGRLFWIGIVVAVALLGAGAVIGVRGYLSTAGPDGAVRGYFTALQRGDASAALAFGDVPAGSRHLLTDAALAVQNRNAPIERVAVRDVARTAERATVRTHYVLEYPGSPQPVDTDVDLYLRDGEWRLTAVAVATELSLPRAGQRATVVGTRVTDATVLLFPGAVPVRLDTGYLTLSPTSSSVGFDAPPTTDVSVDVTAEGRAEARALVSANLLACLHGTGPSTCPEPSERFVPGSLRGALAATPPTFTVSVGASAVGVIEVTGDVRVVGTYRRLAFDNAVRTGKGTVSVPILARAYAVSPLRFAWARSGDGA